LTVAREVMEVGSLGVVEPQRAGQRLEHTVGHAAGVAAFKGLVVLDADAGQRGDIALATIPAWAMLADRIGRKPDFIFGALGSGALMFAYLAAIEHASYPLIFAAGILMSGVVYSAMNGIQPSLYGEMFPMSVRLSGMAIGTQIGYALGGFAPTFAQWIAGGGPGGWVPVAGLVFAASVIAASAALTARETYRVPLEEIDGRATREARFSRAEARPAPARASERLPT
jgi:MFS family permease